MPPNMHLQDIKYVVLLKNKNLALKNKDDQNKVFQSGKK